MGIILLLFFLTLAAAGGLLGGSLGVAFGVIRRSFLQGFFVAIPLMIVGGVAGFFAAAAGMEGNAGNGIKWYGGELEALFPISGAIAAIGIVILIASLVFHLIRGPGQRKEERGPRTRRR